MCCSAPACGGPGAARRLAPSRTAHHLPYYTQVNLGVNHVFHLDGAGTLTARFDVINLFDTEYQIRNGTGVGVGAPQFGPRRGLFFGLSKSL